MRTPVLTFDFLLLIFVLSAFFVVNSPFSILNSPFSHVILCFTHSIAHSNSSLPEIHGLHINKLYLE